VHGGGCTADDGAAKEGSRKEKDEWIHLCWALVLIKDSASVLCLYDSLCLSLSVQIHTLSLSPSLESVRARSVIQNIPCLNLSFSLSLCPSVSISRSLADSRARARAASHSLTLTLSLALSLERSVARSGFYLPPRPFPPVLSPVRRE
jgi:hypothetical protein